MHSDVYVSRSVCIEMYSDMHVLVCVYLLICIITILHIEHADVHICLRIYVYTAIYIYIYISYIHTLKRGGKKEDMHIRMCNKIDVERHGPRVATSLCVFLS